jgi:multiple sugar transport system substrate-binding protein
MRGRALAFLLFVLLNLASLWATERLTRPDPMPGPIHITYWDKWTGDEGKAIRRTVDAFNQSQDKIHVDLMIISGIADKTLLAISGNNPPDVSGLWDFNVAQYADDNALMPLDDFCRRYGVQGSQYVSSAWKPGFYRGHVYALPATPYCPALYVNTRMFREAGLDPTHLPRTIEELDAAADKLTRRDPSGRLTCIGFLPGEPGWWGWGWGYLFGGKLWDGKDKITANCPEDVRAFTWVQSFSKKYGLTELQTFRSGFGNFQSPQNAFLAGKVAMELQGDFMENYITKFAPDLEWAVVPIPYPADRPDLARTTFPGIDTLSIPRGAKHPEEAFQFIHWMQSRDGGMERLCLGQGKYSALRDVSPAFWQQHPNPYIRLFAEQAHGKNAINIPPLGIWPEYQAEMNNAIDEIVLLKKTPRQALDYVQVRMQPKLDKYLHGLRLRGEIR